jgi:surface protein
MFYGCKSLLSLDVKHFNASGVVNLQNVFNGCELLSSIDLSGWTTPKAIVMNGLFSGCSSLAEIKGLDGFITSQVTLFNSMFANCSRLEALDLSLFDVSKATNLDYMFQNCSMLKDLQAMRNIGVDLSVKDSPELSYTSLMSIINNLKSISTVESLKLGALNLGKLSDSDIRRATDKGWSVE